MDIGRAFAFVFDDPEWLKKILIGGLISLIPLVGGFITYGYALEVVRRAYEGAGNELPEWDDLTGYMVRGFLFWVALLVWLLPILLPFACVVTAVIIASNSDSDSFAVLSGILAFVLIGVMLLLLFAWLAVIVPVVAGRYAIERNFGTMFQFGRIMAEVRAIGAMPLLLLFVTCVAANVVGQIGFLACFIGVIFTSFYSYLVMAHGAGQVYRRARGLGDAGLTPQAPAF